MIWLLMLSLMGCDTLMYKGGGSYDIDLSKGPMKLKVKPRQHRFPVADNSLPPPTPAITADQCDDLKDGGASSGPDCATMEIRCGDTVVGHTKGGVNRYNTRFYESNFCTPATTNHDGGDERVYMLRLPPGEHKAFVDLYSPCADLDLAALKQMGNTCPSPDATLPQCEMWPKSGNARERVELVSQSKNGSVWWIVVEGKGNEEGAFSLHVQCRQGLQ